MKKIIFNKKVKFNLDEDIFLEKLNDELKYYPDYHEDEEDVVIKIGKNINKRILSQNPKIHLETNEGFGMDLGSFEIYYEKVDNLLKITVNNKSASKKKLIHKLKKMVSKEFIYPEEAIGQILHELVLVPMTFFFKDLALIHSSAFSFNGKAFLLGGTGGVGKTSTILEIGKEKDLHFICDDIAVIDKDSIIYKNYAYPKIYAYNTIGDEKLEKEILSNTPISSKLQWYLLKKLNPSKVRRKIDPKLLYSIDSEETLTELDSYFIFSRGDYPKLEIKNINSCDAVEMMNEIIKSEYITSFHRHAIWHKFNCKLLEKNKIIDIDEIYTEKVEIYKNAFANKRLYMVEVPKDIDHMVFKEEMLSKLKEKLDLRK